jgi:hypothetical protein
LWLILSRAALTGGRAGVASVARGKALVAKLRADPDVRDAEALAAHLGRFRKARKAGLSVKAAMKAAGGKSGDRKTTSKSPGGLASRISSEKPKSEKPEKKSVFAKKPAFDDDDPFAEDYGDAIEQTKEDKQRGRYEEKMLRALEKQERSRLYEVFMEQGGIQTRDDLREEYREIPNSLKRKDGLPGDEMADYLKTYYPEFGIEDENDLLDYFLNRAA